MASIINKGMEKMDIKRSLNAIVVFSAILVLLTVSVAQAAFFDTAGKSARGMGMGEVFLAQSGDAAGYFYNPAGLSNIESRQVSIGYGKPAAVISNLMTSQINIVSSAGANGGIGLGISYGGIDVASDMVISGGYGVRLSDALAIGGNLKVMRWAAEGQDIVWGTGAGKDDDLSKTAFSLDLSATYALGAMMGLDNLTTGLYVKDAIMPNISESGDDGGKLPIEVGLGLLAEVNDVLVGGDVATVDGETIFRVGAESAVAGSDLTVRGGFIYGSDFADELEKADVDLGLGYVFKSLMFDYAYNLPVAYEESGGRHYVSFGVSF